MQLGSQDASMRGEELKMVKGSGFVHTLNVKRRHDAPDGEGQVKLISDCALLETSYVIFKEIAKSLCLSSSKSPK